MNRIMQFVLNENVYSPKGMSFWKKRFYNYNNHQSIIEYSALVFNLILFINYASIFSFNLHPFQIMLESFVESMLIIYSDLFFWLLKGI